MGELLIEQYDSSLELITEAKSLPKGCLGILKGVCADYGESTRNRRYYSEKLWDKVFKDERVVEGIDTKTMFGELDHPADRLETKIKEVALSLVNVTDDKEHKKIIGEFHILDTPNGRILKSLADYGSKIGVSSRGKGQIVDRGSKKYVDEDTYIFGGFDAVTLPSVKSARPDYVFTNESLEVKNFSETILNEISDSTAEELDKIAKVVDTIELPEETVVSLTEAINLKRESCDSTTIAKKLESDLEEAYSTIETLESKLKGMSEKTKDNTDSIPVATLESTLEDTILPEDLLSEIIQLRADLLNEQSYEYQINQLQVLLSNQKKQEQILLDSNIKLESRISELNEQLVTISEGKSTELSELKEELNTQTKIRRDKINELKSELSEVRESYEEDTAKLQESYDETSQQLAEALESNSKLDYRVEKLKELAETQKLRVVDLQDEVNKFAKAYVEVRADQSGVDAEVLINHLPESFDVDDVNESIKKIWGSRTRINKLPISGSILKVNESSGIGTNDELRQASDLLQSMKPRYSGKTSKEVK